MPNSIAIAIFVKTPEFSPVKTRLAASIGKDAAIQVYEYCLKIVEEKVLKLQAKLAPQIELTLYWAIAETESLNSARWANLSRMNQGDNPQLGKKLDHVYTTLKATHEVVAVMGSDSPFFDLDEVCDGVQWLLNNKNAACIGPTEDGGYYFFASNASLPEKCWTDVTYSENTTREEFLSGLPEKLKVKNLELHWDIDNIEDLNRAAEHDTRFTIESLRQS